MTSSAAPTAPDPALQGALRLTNVFLEILKSMNVLYAEANVEERRRLSAEYKAVLSAYFQARLEQPAVEA